MPPTQCSSFSFMVLKWWLVCKFGLLERNILSIFFAFIRVRVHHSSFVNCFIYQITFLYIKCVALSYSIDIISKIHNKDVFMQFCKIICFKSYHWHTWIRFSGRYPTYTIPYFDYVQTYLQNVIHKPNKTKKYFSCVRDHIFLIIYIKTNTFK